MKCILTPINPLFCLDVSELSPTPISPPKTEEAYSTRTPRNEEAGLTCCNCVCYNDGVCVDGEWEGECAAGHYCTRFESKENNIIPPQKKMNIYYLSQSVNNDYDTYDDCVVAAESEEEARHIHPDGSLWGN